MRWAGDFSELVCEDVNANKCHGVIFAFSLPTGTRFQRFCIVAPLGIVNYLHAHFQTISFPILQELGESDCKNISAQIGYLVKLPPSFAHFLLEGNFH